MGEKNRMLPLSEASRELWVLSGNECAWDECRQRLMDVDGAWVGQVAHIVGAEPGSARHDAGWSKERLRAVDNLMLLCPTHHAKIDHVGSRGQYGAEFLRAVKQRHEARFRLAVDRVRQEFRDATRDNVVVHCVTLNRFWTGEDLTTEDRAGLVEAVNRIADHLGTATLAARQLLSFLVSLDSPVVLSEVARRHETDPGVVVDLLRELERLKLAYLDTEAVEGEILNRVVLWLRARDSVLGGWTDFWGMLRDHLVERDDALLDEVIVGLDFSLLD
jgi:hypothetical protein